ncbi:hypothetical protein V6N13_037868 [Hibiscus sabdariffa]|uniref:Uncharacterized protein n=1 Tax=Hibiscus sabdariffa TaxID=183260 RepID=A0ABR2S403_9ROSI
MYERDEHGTERRGFSDENRSARKRRYYDDGRDTHGRYGQDYRRRRSRYESWTPGRSDWDDGRRERQDKPHRNGYTGSSRRHQPSPAPMFVGTSPDARLVSPWMGDHTPRSTVGASSWDYASSSPVPIRASGASAKFPRSRYGRASHRLSFSRENPQSFEGEANKKGVAEEHNYEITESMRLEMEYNSDRAWEDGTKMSLAQSKKLSQLTADNAQEDRQLLRTGAVVITSP